MLTVADVPSDLDVHDAEDQMSMWICRFPKGEPGGWGRHHHRQHQLVWVSHGLTTVTVDDRSWVLSPTRALWIPGGLPHDVENRHDAVLHCLYVWPASSPVDWTEPTVLAVTPLVRELILCLAEPGLETPVSEAGATMLFSQLAPLSQSGLSLPMPTDERAVELANALLARPSSHRTLDQWARELATSPSTLRRAFVAETGMSFSEWRAQARLQASLPLLADRMGVARVALRVGYSSSSGFVSAFRRQFGHSPGAYHRSPVGVAELAAG